MSEGVWERALRTVESGLPRLGRRLRLVQEAERALVAPGLLDGDLTSYETDWWGHDGIEMHEQAQLARLESWRAHGDLFAALRADPSVNTRGVAGGPIVNGWYGTPDAEAYAAMLASESPGRILEVGGGYSTLIARKTLDFLSRRETKLTVVDPEPRTDVGEAAGEVIYTRIEEVELERLQLEEPLLLFIDSSHVTRSGGDVPFLYTKVIPRLADASIVQVHDIQLPFDYPLRRQARFYTEQYVLHALLVGAPRFRVAYAGAFLGARHPQVMRSVFGETVPRVHGADSFWFTVCA